MQSEIGPEPTAGGIPVFRQIGETPVLPPAEMSQTIVIVGAGPVGLSLALDLGRRGHKVLVLNKLDFIAAGSKAICFSKRTLDIWNRLGVGQAMVDKGVAWSCGKVFWGDSSDPIFSFDLEAVKQQQMPGFINIQQYHVEDILLREVDEVPTITVCWGHEAIGIEHCDDGVTLSVRTAQGDYELKAEWLIACDGSRSPIRTLLGLDFEGRVFEDNFLIADIRIEEERPAERWFWFDPPFNPGQSALYHRQPDGVWRLDFQLGWNIDREACIKPENVEPLVRAMLGDDIEFEPEWYSVYTFQCRRMARFLHGRVLFAGDSAHLVSPFGARGCNGGIADIDNLGWKLDLVLKGTASVGLLESYNYEAVLTADENILNSSRSTDFMTPKTEVHRAFRDAVLELSRDHAFARPFVNSGRLSTAVSYPQTALNSPDRGADIWSRGIMPGTVALDAPTRDGWLLDLLGDEFVLIGDQVNLPVPANIKALDLNTIGDPDGLIRQRYDLRPGSAYLIRPDQYVAARWRYPDAEAIASAVRTASGESSCH